MGGPGPLTRRLHHLIGCDWGHIFRTDDDPYPCWEQATRRITLHNPHKAPNAPDEVTIKVCPKHVSRVLEETNPHEGER